MNPTYIVGGIVLVIVVAVAVAAWRAQAMDAAAPTPATPGGSSGEIATAPATGAGGLTRPLIIRPIRPSSPLAPRIRTTDNNVIASLLRSKGG